MNFPNVYTINFSRKIQGEKNISDYNKGKQSKNGY